MKMMEYQNIPVSFVVETGIYLLIILILEAKTAFYEIHFTAISGGNYL